MVINIKYNKRAIWWYPNHAYRPKQMSVAGFCSKDARGTDPLMSWYMSHVLIYYEIKGETNNNRTAVMQLCKSNSEDTV